MSHVAAKVLPDSYCELGAYISGMPAEAAKDGNKEHRGRRARTSSCTESRRTIFRPASSAMGRRRRALGNSPGLAVSPTYYLKRRLEQWSEGYAVISPHMPGIVRLDDA